MPRIAIVTPSRGLVHSRTIESVGHIISKLGQDFAGWFLTHDRPAPDAQNEAFGAAYDSGADMFLSIEEDNILPPGALDALLKQIASGHSIAFLDYPVGWPQTSHCYYAEPNGKVVWCGLGSTLIHRRVFDAIPRPWFRDDQQIECVRFGNSRLTNKKIIDRKCAYGGFDILFMHDATERGFTIGVVSDMTGGHAWLESWGDKTTNVGGPHKVIIREMFGKHQTNMMGSG